MQRNTVLFITLHIFRNLLPPIPLVARWHTATNTPVPVPETTIYKYRKTPFREDYIRVSRQAATMCVEAEPRSSQSLRNALLRLGAPRHNTRHYPASCLDIECVSHLAGSAPNEQWSCHFRFVLFLCA